MRYVNAGLIGALAGVVAGVVLGVPLMCWGPGSDDPLAALWLLFGALVTAPAGLVVGLVLARGARTGRLVAGALAGPAVLGALLAMAVAFATLREEVLDEWFNLPVFGAMGAAAGALTSIRVRVSGRPRSQLRNGRP